MRLDFGFAFCALVSMATANIILPPNILKTTAQRITEYNYPVETHMVQTSDGYILTMFRIPYSPTSGNQNTPRPVVFLQHGLLSSSDCWILNGPDNALAYLLADAGYDVWMGNARGNTYSKNHIFLTPAIPSFWQFSWNEIAIKDMPAMIDFVLQSTNQPSLHYVGHSQGTTVFFVLLSTLTSYNAKIKTAHMLAPVAFMEHMSSPLATVLGPVLGDSTLLSQLIGSGEFLPSNQLLELLGSAACLDSSPVQEVCTNAMFLIFGYNSNNLNNTLLSDAFATHPAGASTRQPIHYLQLRQSKSFRKFDYGSLTNLLKYGQLSPPNYVLNNIVAPVRLYYGANDNLAAVVDVVKLITLLPNVVDAYLVPNPYFNHIDLIWGKDVKDLLYLKIIAATNYYESTGGQQL